MPSVTTQRTRSRYPWPSLLLAATAILCATTPLDRMAASAFYDPALGDFLAHRAVWAAVAHRAGIWLVAGVAILALVLAAASWRWPKLRTWRREAVYVVVCIALATGTVGWLKGVTNVDCPWDQSTFGGTRPDIGWLDRRPAGLPKEHCFPGGHASGGFSLLALAAVYGRRRPEAAGGGRSGRAVPWRSRSRWGSAMPPRSGRAARIFLRTTWSVRGSRGTCAGGWNRYSAARCTRRRRERQAAKIVDRPCGTARRDGIDARGAFPETRCETVDCIVSKGPGTTGTAVAPSRETPDPRNGRTYPHGCHCG
jgi:membrane-associated PAP2 superfamily phosphatase